MGEGAEGGTVRLHTEFEFVHLLEDAVKCHILTVTTFNLATDKIKKKEINDNPYFIMKKSQKNKKM